MPETIRSAFLKGLGRARSLSESTFTWGKFRFKVGFSVDESPLGEDTGERIVVEVPTAMEAFQAAADQILVRTNQHPGPMTWNGESYLKDPDGVSIWGKVGPVSEGRRGLGLREPLVESKLHEDYQASLRSLISDFGGRVLPDHLRGSGRAWVSPDGGTANVFIEFTSPVTAEGFLRALQSVYPGLGGGVRDDGSVWVPEPVGWVT